MKKIIFITTSMLIFIGSHASAKEPIKIISSPRIEPIKCYENAWKSKEDGGLGLTAGQAVTLCGSTKDSNKVLQCFSKAWAHPDDGGLGLNAGQAVSLCKENSLQ